MNKALTDVAFLMKFGSKENIYDLYEHGTIYFNSIDYFQKLEEQGLRGDNYEGTTRIMNYGSEDKIFIELSLPNGRKIANLKPSKLHHRDYLKNLDGNIFCLYALKLDNPPTSKQLKFDKRLKQFGTHFLIIQDIQKFFGSIAEKLDALDIPFDAGLVSYYDRNIAKREIGQLEKPMEYEYQSEFRIILYHNSKKPFVLKIGSLAEISMIFEINALDDVRLEVKKQLGNKNFK